MEPIISPWFFYWVEKVDIILTIASVLLSLLAFVCFIFLVANCLWDDDSSFQNMVKILKRGTLIMIVPLLIVLCVPSSETIYKMMLAQYATSDNIAMVIEQIKNAAEWLATLK